MALVNNLMCAPMYSPRKAVHVCVKILKTVRGKHTEILCRASARLTREISHGLVRRKEGRKCCI